MLSLVATAASAQTAKPRVPPGADPGGVPVAYIGGGVAYTIPQIASRLARDGEGEIIGWDFIDNDRRPLDRCAQTPDPLRAEEKVVADEQCSSHPPWQLTREATKARLVVVRATAERPQTLVQAITVIARTPARIVLMSRDAASNLTLLEQAAARFPALLFVVPAHPEAAAAGRDNIVSVARIGIGRKPEVSADVAISAVSIPHRSGEGAAVHYPTDVAAARIAALAAQLLAIEPGLDAAGVKRRIVLASERGTGAADGPIPGR